MLTIHLLKIFLASELVSEKHGKPPRRQKAAKARQDTFNVFKKKGLGELCGLWRLGGFEIPMKNRKSKMILSLLQEPGDSLLAVLAKSGDHIYISTRLDSLAKRDPIDLI